MSVKTFSDLSAAQMHAFRKANRLLVLTNGHQIESDTILHLTPGEMVTVEYTYTMPIEKHRSNGADRSILNLVLQAPQAPPAESSNNTPINTANIGASNTTTGTVWVEWMSAHPSEVTSSANDIFVERATRAIEQDYLRTSSLIRGKKNLSFELLAKPG